MTRVTAILALAFALALGACEKDQFKGAEAEVGRDKVKPDLPPVPTFALPDLNADGSMPVKILRVNGRKYFEKEVTVKGTVTWIYDCFATLRNNEEYRDRTDEQIRKYIGEEPDRYCRKPLFRIGASATDPDDQTIKVVNVPRKPTATEIKLLPKEELANKEIWRPVCCGETGTGKKKMLVPLAIGDEVVVTGIWTQRAPTGGESDMQGLLVYATMQNVTKAWDTATALAAVPTK